MQLEQEIKQTNFISQHQKLMLNVMATNNRITYWLKDIFQQHGLTMQQYNIIRIPRGAKQALSTTQIKERMLDKNSNISRIVDRMILKDLVAKSTSAEDKRLVSITISEIGLKILHKIDQIEHSFFDPLKTLTEEECRIANQLLDKIK